MQFCGVIPALNPVQLRFLIVDITTIAERVALAQRIGQRAGGAQQLAPCIVLVFYYKRAGAVKNANDISLQIVDVGIDNTIVTDLYRAGLRIVEEMQFVLLGNLIPVGVIHRHVGKQLAMVGVVRRLRIPAVLQHLLDAHTVVVVLEGERLSFAGHLLKLATDCPFIRPATIIQRIADCVIRDRSTIVRGQFVLPVRITVSIRNRLNSRADSTGGIGVAYLAGDVSATIVVIDPRRVLMRVVHSDELSKRIVSSVRRHRDPPAFPSSTQDC